MAMIHRLWLAMLTHNTSNAGTDDETVLIVNTGGSRDRVHHTFYDSAQRDQEKGEANLYDFPTSFLESDDLNASSVRVGIRGDDTWRPENLFVWAETDGPIIPLAIVTDITKDLSTDPGPEKVSPHPALSIPITRARVGSETTGLDELLMLMTTADTKYAGTDSKIELQVSAGGALAVNFEFPLTPQQDQERAQANWYFVPVNNPLTKADITNVSLRIKGEDKWTPENFFLFGFDTRGDIRPFSMVPLVHEREWTHGSMSTDSPKEGESSVTLDLVVSPPPTPPSLPTAPTQLTQGSADPN